MQDVGARHAQAARDALHVVFGERAALDQGRRGKGQALAVLAQRHQAHAAFLHDAARRARLAARGKPGMAGAQRGVASEGQLAPGAEDAHAVVGTGGAALGRGRQHEGGLGEVGPVRELLHGLGGEAFAIEHHGQRVAQAGRGGEHIDLLEGALVHGGWALVCG